MKYESIAKETQGVKYAGSKLKIIPQILRTIEPLGVSRIWDGFSGSTRVSQAFSRAGYSVESNDVSLMSKTFGEAFLMNKEPISHYQEIIEHLNQVKGYDGWFTENYGGEDRNGLSIQSDGLKKLWQFHNTQKLDGIRDEIDNLQLNDLEKSVVLVSLMLALDSVDSSLGHFTSYLRQWSPRSYKTMQLVVPKLITNDSENLVTTGNILETCNPVKEADLAYFDPPYGSNNELMPYSRVRYNSYYHIWKTIILNDKPTLFGAAKRREDSRDTVSQSPFEEYKRNPVTNKFLAVESIEKLLRKTDTPFVLLSYSNGGRATKSDLLDVLQSSGKIISAQVINHQKNVMAQMKWTGDWVTEDKKSTEEFLFLVKK